MRRLLRRSCGSSWRARPIAWPMPKVTTTLRAGHPARHRHRHVHAVGAPRPRRERRPQPEAHAGLDRRVHPEGVARPPTSFPRPRTPPSPGRTAAGTAIPGTSGAPATPPPAARPGHACVGSPRSPARFPIVSWNGTIVRHPPTTLAAATNVWRDSSEGRQYAHASAWPNKLRHSSDPGSAPYTRRPSARALKPASTPAHRRRGHGEPQIHQQVVVVRERGQAAPDRRSRSPRPAARPPSPAPRPARAAARTTRCAGRPGTPRARWRWCPAPSPPAPARPGATCRMAGWSPPPSMDR